MDANTASHLKVAIADDDTTLLSMLNELLSDEGYVVSAFTDAQYLKEAAYHQNFDIVLTDINMPQCTGIELLRYLREELESKAKVIIMTANAQVDSAIEAVQLGAMDYLQKPFNDIEEVIQLVNKAADQIFQDKRHDSIINAVIERTKKLVAMQHGGSQVPSDLQGLLERTESLVKNLQSDDGDAKEHTLSGAIEEIGLPNLLQMLGMVGKPGILKMQGEDWEGSIWYYDGKMMHAVMGRVTGMKAVHRLLQKEIGEFYFIHSNDPPENPTLSQSMDNILLDGLRRMDDFNRLGPGKPPLDLVLYLHRPPDPTLIQEDQVILEFVMRYNRVQEILDYSPYPDLETIYGLIRLKMAGYINVNRP